MVMMMIKMLEDEEGEEEKESNSIVQRYSLNICTSMYLLANNLQIGKGVHQGCILSPYLLNLYAEHIMRNAGLEATQAGIKIAGRNITNLRYADDTTLMAESEEELKSLLMRERRVKKLA